MIVHAFSAYIVAPEHDGLSVQETADYWYWLDTATPDAEANAAARYDEMNVLLDHAVTQYRIELPAHVTAKVNDPEFGDALHEFMDNLEWDLDWAGAPVVRRNAVAEQLAKDADARGAARDAA